MSVRFSRISFSNFFIEFSIFSQYSTISYCLSSECTGIAMFFMLDLEICFIASPDPVYKSRIISKLFDK